MKIVFMGTPEFSVPTLEALLSSEHDISAVVSQPDKPKGRGKKIAFSPVKELALKHKIPILQPQRVKEIEFLDKLKELKPDVIIVIAFGQILPKAILELPPYGCINIHASLLPKYRGAGPIQWSIINGEQKTGLTTMVMDVGMDTGDMLLKEEVEIDLLDTGESLSNKLSSMGGDLILKTLRLLEEGSIKRTPQNHEVATYAPMLTKELGHIHWNQEAETISNLIRGLNPWPSAFSYYQGKQMKIWQGEIVENNSPMEPGMICDIFKDKGFVVKCKDKGILVTVVQLQGKKILDAPAFLRGVSIQLGEKLD